MEGVRFGLDESVGRLDVGEQCRASRGVTVRGRRQVGACAGGEPYWVVPGRVTHDLVEDRQPLPHQLGQPLCHFVERIDGEPGTVHQDRADLGGITDEEQSRLAGEDFVQTGGVGAVVLVVVVLADLHDAERG